MVGFKEKLDEREVSKRGSELKWGSVGFGSCEAIKLTVVVSAFFMRL